MKKIRFKKMMVNLCLVAILAMGSGSIVYAAGNIPTFHSVTLKRSNAYTRDKDNGYNRTSTDRSTVGVYANGTILAGDTIRVRIADGDNKAVTSSADFVKGDNYHLVNYKAGVKTSTKIYFSGRLLLDSASSSRNFTYALTP